MSRWPNIKSRVVLSLGGRLFVSALAVRLLALFLIGSCTAFAPDEMGYYYSFIRAFENFSMSDGDYWTGISQFSLQVIYFPAYLLHLAQVPILWALRFESLLLFSLTLIVLWRGLGLSNVVPNRNFIGKVCILILTSILFLPSAILWTSFGLRESFIFFSLSLIVVSFYKLNESQNHSLITYAVFFVGLSTLGIVKIHIFVLVISAILIAEIISTMIKCTKFKVILLLSSSLLIFVSCALLQENLQSLLSRTASVTASDALTLSDSNENLQSRTGQEIARCSTQNEGGILINLLASKLSTSENPTSASTDSISEKGHDSISASNKYLEKIMLFLLFPINSSTQSISSLEGTLESIIWIPLYFWLFFLFSYSLRRDKLGTRSELLFVYLFVIAFVGFSIYTEVNFGTAIRHRSILLLPIGFLTLSFMKGLNKNEV